ncbi:MAG: hypothetical protein QOI50_1628, partial [Pseudonocardiales bacterium]|nr:hypothetical protein [Pseudonocardiales bacterium]
PIGVVVFVAAVLGLYRATRRSAADRAS